MYKTAKDYDYIFDIFQVEYINKHRQKSIDFVKPTRADYTLKKETDNGLYVLIFNKVVKVITSSYNPEPTRKIYTTITIMKSWIVDGKQVGFGV